MNPEHTIRTGAAGRRAAAIRDGRAEAGGATTAVMAPPARRALALSTLNALTATGQVVSHGAYHAARCRVEHAEAWADNHERRDRCIREAIQWQKDAAELSAKARANYLADNGLGHDEADA